MLAYFYTQLLGAVDQAGSVTAKEECAAEQEQEPGYLVLVAEDSHDNYEILTSFVTKSCYTFLFIEAYVLCSLRQPLCKNPQVYWVFIKYILV